MENMPEVPADLSELSAEELAALREELAAYVAENAPNAETAEQLEALAALADGVDAIKTREAGLVAEETDRVNRAQELVNRVAPAVEADDKTEVEVEVETETETETEKEPEAVAAAATPKRLPAAARRRPAPVSAPVASLTAAATGVALDAKDLPQRLMDAHRGLKQGEAATVATITASADTRPRLTNDEVENSAIIAAAVADRTKMLTNLVYGNPDEQAEAMVAAGGLCAPTEGLYSVFTLGDAARPVTGALPSFTASRGGIRWQTPPTLADIDISGAGAAVDIRTEAQDAATVDESFAYKTCQAITCGGDNEAVISAIYKCLEFGNFGSRTYPELVTAWTDLAGVAHARLAETAVLDKIAAGSTAVTFATGDTGAAREILGALAQAVAGYRSRARMLPGSVLEVLLPSWTRELVAADYARTLGSADLVLGAVGRWETAIRDLGIALTYYLDTKTGGGQVFGTQSSGALVVFPDPKAYIYAPGSFLFLDGGTLDLGTVRDSTLNLRNSFQVFSETFEQVAKVGGPSLELTITTSPTGNYAAAATSLPEA